MNPHTRKTISVGPRLVGLTLAAALASGLACSDSGGGPSTGKGGSTGTAGHGGTTGSAGTGGSTAGTTGTAGSGGSTTGIAGTGGNAMAGTGGNATGGTGGAKGGTSGSMAGTGGNATGTAGTGGNATGTAGTGGNATGTAGTGGTASGGNGGGGNGGGGAPWLSLPANLPPTLNPPANTTLKLHLHATGDQIYTCTAASAGSTGAGGAGGSGVSTYSYVLKQPDAKLYDQSNTQVGTHGAGPNWTSTVDASVVMGAKVWGENAPAPTTGAVQWLLLRATSNSGTGAFSDVTYVIRGNTTGGVAPATGCDSTTAGMDFRVPYTADYYFLTGGGQAAWGTLPANIPTAIAVPSGAAYKSHYHAIGVQVYTCTASTGGTSGGGGAGGTGGSGATTYSWVLKQPDAVLYDSMFAMAGTHGAGPNWTSTDGSIVVGARVNSAAGMAGAVPWLLLQAMSNTPTGTGPGAFGDVTYVQRLNTAGGPAPASGCDSTTATTETRIPYSADYYFFTGGVTTDGGTNG
jgi:hypothetical protein